MINRENYSDLKAYIKYLTRTRKLASESTRVAWSRLRHLIEWADERPLSKAPSIKPSFPDYLICTRSDGRDGALTLNYLKRVCREARNYFSWARREWPTRYPHRIITNDWIDGLRPPREATENAEHTSLPVFTLEDVLKVLALSPRSLKERRTIAAIAYLFASGMRADAFVSMPIKAVCMKELEVQQKPELGMRTKNRKSAVTYLLEIPELLPIISEWDTLVRSQLSPDAPWYACINSEGTGFAENQKPGRARAHNLRRRIKEICARAGLPAYSPHALRRGHIVYAATLPGIDFGDFLAISRNVMHENTRTTELYAKDLGPELKSRIRNLGTKRGSGAQMDVSIQSLKDTTARIEAMLRSGNANVAQLCSMVQTMKSVLIQEGIPEPLIQKLIGQFMTTFAENVTVPCDPSTAGPPGSTDDLSTAPANTGSQEFHGS